tara:strand:- start:1665 stop:3245 length:1581 start_codon:yes stop_codon:yes gene_type:complete
MFFGNISLDKSEGNILAHTLNINNKRFSKGKIILKEDIKFLKNNGFKSIICAVPNKNDIHEDKIAKILGKLFVNNSIVTEDPHTGRVNILANKSGLIIIDEKVINKFNATSDSITIATLNNYSKINKGDMIATIKIIPFYVSLLILKKISNSYLKKTITIHPFKQKNVGLILSHSEKENSKLNQISIKRINDRLNLLNSSLTKIITCKHDTYEISKNIKILKKQPIDLILILGASAIVDIKDKIPKAIQLAKGCIIRFGMPVDPGNLLLLGKIKNIPVIGLPGCARSPSLNGFDWVLERLLVDKNISSQNISNMGVGGLLKTINKNKTKIKKYNISNIILAAGQSKRMKDKNKLLLDINNKKMIQNVIDSAINSNANNNIVVVGYQYQKIEKYIKDNITITMNKEYKKGLSSSLKKGISTLPEDCDAVIIILGDMPKINTHLINSLINGFNPNDNKYIVTPTYNGKRGNPILIGRKYFPDILKLKGDIGAKDILNKNSKYIHKIPQKNSSSLIDIDTNQDYKKFNN